MDVKCLIENCERVARSKGWCKSHYDAWRKHGDPNAYRGDRKLKSLWEKIQEIGWTRMPNGCLEYNGYRNKLGYGQFRDAHRLHRVHRLVFENLVGRLEPDEKVRHKCDNPPCGDPSHLLKGTQGDNIQDMHDRGRNYKADWVACPNGHPYPEDRPAGVDKNRCQECARDRNRRYHARQKQEEVYGMAR